MKYELTHKTSPKRSEIVRARTAAGLTQQQLADELHVSRQSVTRWETGVHKMPAGRWELFLIKYKEKLVM
jgi:DNA-binding transcriptional regulator YiaG